MSDYYSEGDVVQATKGETVLRGRVLEGGRIIGTELGDWTVDRLQGIGFRVELIKKAKSASQKALDDAPRNSFIRRGEMNRTFWKGRNLKWYEIQHDYQGDPPKIIEVEGDELTYWLPKWLDNRIQKLHVPEGY